MQDSPVLILQKVNRYGEDFIIFSSNEVDCQARLHTMDETIVVEHDVSFVGTATYDIEDRHLAIAFIESLFLVYHKDMDEAYMGGVMCALTTMGENPYDPIDDRLLHHYWNHGYMNEMRRKNPCEELNYII